MPQPLHVLIVEDNPQDTELVLRELRHAGFEPAWRRVDTEADYLEHLDPDLEIILSDFAMPQFNGFRALELLKERGFDIPFFIVSGTIGEETAVEAMKLGATDYLLKDRLTRLGPAVVHALEQSRLRRERKLAAETLRLRESALDEVSQGVLICDENRLITYANASFSKITGYPESEILGRNSSILQGPDTSPETILKIRTALNAGKTFEGEILNYRKDGRKFWNDLSITPILDEHGRPLRFIGIQRDVTERKRIDEGFRLFRTLVDQSNDSFEVIDPETGRFLDVNEKGAADLGYSREEYLALRVFDIDPMLDATTWPPLMERMRSIGSLSGEGHHQRKDGSIFPIEFSAIWVHLDRDYIVSVVRDITERKLALETLQKSEEHVRRERALLRTLIDSIPDLIFIKDKESVFLGCNKAFENHLGVSGEKLIGGTDYDIVPRDLADGYRRNDGELLASGKAQRTEDWIPFKNGGGGHFETLKTPYYGPDGESLGLIGVSRDITERKQAEENQRMLLERLKLATEAAQVGIWEMDIATQKMDWDAQMRALYGLPENGSSNVIEQIYQTMHPDDMPRVTIEFEEALRLKEKPLNTEFRITRAGDGAARVIRAMATVLRNDAGEPLRIIGTNWDVTEERARERELATALAQEKLLVREAEAGNRAKSEFLAVMSHEIRTPMNGILGFSELLAGIPNLPAEGRDYVKTIASSGEALLRILDDILDYSRLEAGGLKIEPSFFPPRVILQDIQTLLAPHANDKHLEFRLNVEDGAPERLWNDAGRLRQILLNLVGNAVKFTEHGSISLGIRHGREPLKTGAPCVEFFVRDTGPGILAEKLDHIFEPFAQADSSISRRYGGTGLGLSISRNLVGLMGGKLTVASKPGEGSEFCVCLPIEAADGATPAAPPSSGEPLDESFAQHHPLRILLVEDDRVNLKLMLMMLRKLGYEPLTAQDGVEAVEVYRCEHPNCILMDLQMPRKDGLQATLEIREMENGAPAGGHAFIAALTANIVAEDRQRCFHVGMDDYMNKPIKRDQLARTLALACNGNNQP